MNFRLLAIGVMLLVASAGRWHLEAVEPAAAKDLRELPMVVEEWTGHAGPRLDPAVLQILKADDSINRVYQTDAAMAALFVGYYRSQKFGATIHSPLNCLPGAGWQPLRSERLALGDAGTVKQVLIQKGEDRQVVLYWYQSVRRIEGSEYWSKLHLVGDAVSTRRNDAALVRIVVPVESKRPDGEAVAARVAHRLAVLIQPRVAALLFRSGERAL
jgi:EpsI family protein